MAENGNVAAMREALEEIDKNTDLLDIAEDLAPDLFPSHSFVALQIRKIARAALSKPPRNCDVGTAEEQRRRKREYCKETQCSGCPANKGGTISTDRCDFTWAQMPFDSKGKCEDAQ